MLVSVDDIDLGEFTRLDVEQLVAVDGWSLGQESIGGSSKPVVPSQTCAASSFLMGSYKSRFRNVN
jgi:hypothetical protein